MADIEDSTIITQPIRRFAVQAIETISSSHRSSKKKVEDVLGSTDTLLKQRFLPQPEETTVRSNRKSGANLSTDHAFEDGEDWKELEKLAKQGLINGERQFVPQLIETGKRSRKNGDGTLSSSLQQTDKTDFSPGDRTYQPRHIRLARPPIKVPENTPHHSMNRVHQVSESRFSYASLSTKKPRKRQSFQIPALASITSAGDSDDSVESNVPSLSTTPSAVSEEVGVQNRVRRIHKESHDETHNEMSGYILSLAATAAKRQLQEQALAAFPNERHHQAVNHFAIDDDDDSNGSDEDVTAATDQQLDDPDFYQRRMSSAGWDLLEIQRHKEMREEQRRQQRLFKQQSQRQKSEYDPWSNPYDLSTLRISRLQVEQESNATLGGGALRDVVEVSKMRHAASPPMLGGDLRFPQSLSPQHTMMDPTQRPVRRKRGKSVGIQSRSNSGLWTPSAASPMVSRKNTESGRYKFGSIPSAGLWGGLCQSAEYRNDPITSTPEKPKVQSGLTTPANERADPFSPAPTPILTPYYQLPITPALLPEKDDHLDGIDSVLQLEVTINEEYPDSFITQVYNYLSLGYPALARDYDLELSKISRVPVDDIQRGDDRVDYKGHIGAPESEGWDETKCMEECGRWTALRLYIREWARQQPKFREENESRKAAARARRGSWGV